MPYQRDSNIIVKKMLMEYQLGSGLVGVSSGATR
jgi:hypothetical protein